MVWFVTSRKELEGAWPRDRAGMGPGLWVAWPKKASGVVTDVTEDVVRAAGLAHGLVDYKVCAINEIWSGLKFARRKKWSARLGLRARPCGATGATTPVSITQTTPVETDQERAGRTTRRR